MNTGVEPASPAVAPVMALPHTPLSAAEQLNRPTVAVVDDELGYHATVAPEDARAVLNVECQLHIDMVYVVTRTEHNEFVLWRMEHAGLAPARLTGEIKQRMLSAPGTIKDGGRPETTGSTNSKPPDATTCSPPSSFSRQTPQPAPSIRISRLGPLNCRIRTGCGSG